jgi:hypothetical protein
MLQLGKLWPYLETLDEAGKACQGRTQYLTLVTYGPNFSSLTSSLETKKKVIYPSHLLCQLLARPDHLRPREVHLRGVRQQRAGRAVQDQVHRGVKRYKTFFVSTTDEQDE